MINTGRERSPERSQGTDTVPFPTEFVYLSSRQDKLAGSFFVPFVTSQRMTLSTRLGRMNVLRCEQ